MRLGWSKWFYGIAGAAVTGFSNSILSALGVNMAKEAGVNVPNLDLKQLAVITIVGGIVGTAAYLKQSPVPKDLDDGHDGRLQ